MPNEPVNPKIRVSENAGAIDSIQAAARYASFLVTAVVAILGFLQAKDAVGLMAYIQSSGGQIVAAVSGLAAFGIAAYGVFKTWKRGAQVATVAADPRVPDKIAALK